MTENEENFIHFVSCVDWLNNAWVLLKKIESQQSNPLTEAAFRFALVEYCKPYKFSHGSHGRKFKLDTSFILKKHLSLHERIIAARDKNHAHLDISILDAKLHIHELMGRRNVSISQNNVCFTEELSNLLQIVDLIETSLEMMYAHQKRLEERLTL